MLPTTCLMYHVRYDISSVCLRMFCHTIFRGDEFKTLVRFSMRSWYEWDYKPTVQCDGSLKYIPFLLTRMKYVLINRQSQERESTYNKTLRQVHVTSVAMEELKYWVFWECAFVALVIHKGKRMRRISIVMCGIFCFFISFLIIS
jgi:hypothetical protein